MRRLLAPALLLSLCLSPSVVSAETHPQTQTIAALHLVQKIYIEELGSTDEAARFRLLLEDKLTQRGFVVVDKPDRADAVLRGALSVSSAGKYGGASDISVTVRLYSSQGERLWSINLPKPATFSSALKVRGFRFKEPVEHRAEELAKELRNDWEKSAKAPTTKNKK